MAILKVVFDEISGLIRISDIDPAASTTEGILKVTDPLGVVIYENAGFATDNLTNPDLDSGTPEFTVDIPTTSEVNQEGEYTINYKTIPAGAETEPTSYEKVLFWRPKRPKVCIEHVTNCLCSKVTYSDTTQYGSGYTINSRSWKANQPVAAAQAQVTGTNETVTVGPNIWTGPHDAELTVSATIDHGENVSSILKLVGYLRVDVSCDSKKQIYNLLAATKDKYETLAITDPGQAAVGYREKIQLATVYAQLAEMAFDLGEWNAYEKALESLKKIAPDCGCDDCLDCGDDYPTEIEPLCAGGGSGDGLSTEEIQDMISTFIQAGDNIQITYNDGANNITIAAIIDTPAGVNSSYFRWNASTSKWESGGGNGVFVRLVDGGSYNVVSSAVDPVIYASEDSTVTFPNPDDVDSRFKVTVVFENTDASEPPESSSCSLVFPDGKYATLETDSIGRPADQFQNATAGFKALTFTNGKTLVMGIVTGSGGVKKWAPIFETTRFINDPKIPNLQSDFANDGFALKYDYFGTDLDGFPGTFKKSSLGHRVIRIGPSGNASLGVGSGQKNIYHVNENSIIRLPSVQAAFDLDQEFYISHENTLANQPYGTSDIQITCGDNGLGVATDRFAVIGDTSNSGSTNMGVEPTRLVLDINTHTLSLKNGEFIRLSPYVSGSIKKWVGVITSRFGASSGGGGSFIWGDALGDLEDQADLWDALGLKLDKTDYTASDVASKYASVVPKVSGSEIAAGSGTVLRTYSPADIVALIAAHAPETTGFLDMYDTRGDLTTAYATPPAADSWAIIKEDVELAVANSGAWKFQYIDGYSLDSATVTQLENDGNFTSGVYSGSTILAADLVAGKMHTKTGSDNIIYMCVNAASPYWVRIDVSGGGGGGGATNLSYTASPTQGQVNSDTGSDAVVPLSDGTNAGLMSPAQHTKVAASITELSEDTTPVLGGNLDDGGFTIAGRNVATDGAKLDTIIAPEYVDATAGDVGSVKLNSPYAKNFYGHTNPHTQSTVVINATGLVQGGNAEIRIQSAAKPTTWTLSGATFNELYDWTLWDDTNVNRVGVECRIAGGSPVIDLYYLGSE